jgi:hypothetical protein
MSARKALVAFTFLAALTAAALTLPGSNADAQSIAIVAADANPAGNTATSLGARDSCVRVEPGAEVTVDFTVDAIPADRPFLGFSLTAVYDPNLLEVTAANSDLLLGAVGQYQPFPGLSDPLPDTDGQYLVSIADLASNNPDGQNMESGPGVLSRVTFRAKAAGRSDVGPGFSTDPANEMYPQLIDVQNNMIQVDAVANTVVAIGQECGSVPPESQVQPLPPLVEILGTGTPLPTAPPADGATAAPTPEGQTPAAESATPGASADATSEAEPTASAEAVPSTGDSGDGGDSDTAALIGALVLGGAGVAMAAAGGTILYRRRTAAGNADEFA